MHNKITTKSDLKEKRREDVRKKQWKKRAKSLYKMWEYLNLK